MSDIQEQLESLEGEVMANRLMIASIVRQLVVYDPDIGLYLRRQFESLTAVEGTPPEEILKTDAIVRSIESVISKAFQGI